MIVGYDALNHALLVHFGAAARASAPRVEVWEMSYTASCQTRVETAFDPETGALVAIHFWRRGFFMPSFDSSADLRARWRYVRGPSEIRIDLAVVPKLHDPVWVGPGIELFVSLPQRTGRQRPFLHGFRVSTGIQPVEIDASRLDLRVVPNSLAEAGVGLFVELRRYRKTGDYVWLTTA